MDRSYNSVRPLLEELIELRKNAPRQISDIQARENKEILECLREVKITLDTNSDLSNYTNKLNIPFENVNLNEVQQFDRELLDKIYKQIQLLRILIKKKDCPISKIIDEI